MPRLETPADAIDALVRKFQGFNNHMSVMQALMQISSSNDSSELVSFVSDVNALLRRTRQAVGKSDLDEEQRVDIEEALSGLDYLVDLKMMHADWISAKNNGLPIQRVKTLRLLGPAIRQVSLSSEISQPEIEDLERDVNSLMESMRECNLPEQLKEKLLAYLRLILLRLLNYRIGGKEALRNAVSFVAGDLAAFREEFEPAEASGIGARFRQLVGRLVSRLRAVSDDIERIEDASGNIQAISDLFAG